jgi:hypothetical protein
VWNIAWDPLRELNVKINTRKVGLPAENGEHSTIYYLENTKYN